MKYDDASWHFDAEDFPKNLPQSAGATHIGMFVTWAVLNGLMSDEFTIDFSEQIQKLKSRQINPGQFVWQYMEGKFSDYDLSEKDRVFANIYYTEKSANNYLASYESSFKGNLVSEYLISDTWETYEKVSAIINRAYLQASMD